MESEGGLPSFIAELDGKRRKDTLEDCIRVYVDHYMIPRAIRSAIPPFDEIPEDGRIEMTREAEVFRDQ